MFLRSKGQHRPKVNKFVKFLKSSIFIRLTWNLKRIYISGHWIKPANYFWGQQTPKGLHWPKVSNQIVVSKILTFHPTNLKFEEDFHIRSLNSTVNYFDGQICFVDLTSIVLCMSSFLFVTCENRIFLNYNILVGRVNYSVFFVCLSVCLRSCTYSYGLILLKIHIHVPLGNMWKLNVYKIRTLKSTKSI